MKTELLSLSAVASISGATRDTVLKAIKRGDLSATPILDQNGRVVTYGVRRCDAEKWKPRMYQKS